MTLAVGLNLIWGSIALAALLFLAVAEGKHAFVRFSGRRIHRLAAVLLVVLSLFPCVSASDDMLGLSSLEPVQHLTGADRTPAQDSPTSPGSSNSTEKAALHLARVLQSLESLKIVTAFVFCLSLSCFGLIFLSRRNDRARQIPCLVGRGPPSFVL